MSTFTPIELNMTVATDSETVPMRTAVDVEQVALSEEEQSTIAQLVEDVADLKSDLAHIDFSALRTALLQLADSVAYKDDEIGEEVQSDLYDALYPPAELSSISAVYTQGGTVYTDDSLDSLKTDLVVTAHYSDSTSETLSSSDYTLSGTLASGTSTITVTYQDKTATFDVTVTAPLYSIPDFAAQTLALGDGKSVTVKKENGVFNYTGYSGDVCYIYPNGTANVSKSNTTWMELPTTSSVKLEIYDINWSNASGINMTLDCKFSRSDTTGNVMTASLPMARQSSGTNQSASYENAEYPSRPLSAFAIQFGSGKQSTFTVVASFKVKFWVDGVRWL